MSYTIVYAWYDTMSGKPSFEEALRSLVGSVSKALEEGWEPVGGVAARVDGKDRYQYVIGDDETAVGRAGLRLGLGSTSPPQGLRLRPPAALHKAAGVLRSSGDPAEVENVRIDGETILCATMDEKDRDWRIHKFTSRF